jgi:hypothetical protein
MIKRDLIRRYAVITTPDGMGGSPNNREPKEFVKVNVSVNATIGEITQYGVKNEMIIHVVSNVELDDYIYTRYEYSGKMFKLMRQIKQGNEYYSTLIETDN